MTPWLVVGDNNVIVAVDVKQIAGLQYMPNAGTAHIACGSGNFWVPMTRERFVELYCAWTDGKVGDLADLEVLSKALDLKGLSVFPIPSHSEEGPVAEG